MTDRLGRAYERGFEDGAAGREFCPPYVKTENRDWYAHGYYSGEYTLNQQQMTWARQAALESEAA